MKEVIKRVMYWADARNLTEPVNARSQGLKLTSEFGELCKSVRTGADVRDDIGDNQVVAIVISGCKGYDYFKLFDQVQIIDPDKYTIEQATLYAGQVLGLLVDELAKGAECDKTLVWFVEWLQIIAAKNGHTLKECLEIAYTDIKDRKGILFEGVFIKESDDKYLAAFAAVEAARAGRRIHIQD